MHVVIFEGARWPTFAPLSLSRPVFTLMSGMGTLLEKQVRYLRPTRLTLWVRPELEEHCRVRLVPNMPVPTEVNQPLDDEPALLVGGRELLFGPFEYSSQPAVVLDEEGTIRSAFVREPGLAPRDVLQRTDRWLALADYPRVMAQGRTVESLWDLIHWNEEALIADATRLPARGAPRPPGPYHLVNAEDVWLGDGVALEPGCVLDASAGPVVLGERVRVGANAVIKGPVHLGAYTHVSPLSTIRSGTTTGTMCRIGGEVSNSIIHGYTNKSHDGYLGDSYLGRWVNLGAGTTTSNLKNTYGEITTLRAGKEIPTGRRFLGALIGDHVKTAIHTRLTAGTYVGFCSSLAVSSTVPRFVPSYTFLTDAGAVAYRMDKAVEVTQRVFARRDRPWTETDARMMQYVERVAPEIEGVRPAAAPPKESPPSGHGE